MIDFFANLLQKIFRKQKAKKRQFTASAIEGLWGEKIAEDYLVKSAELKTIGRRVRFGSDEIDLVMEHKNRAHSEIVFVEVKTRSRFDYGGGRAAMTRRKRHALCRAVSRYMRKCSARPFRIDLVEVYGLHYTGEVFDIVHHQNAVPMERRFISHALSNSRKH